MANMFASIDIQFDKLNMFNYCICTVHVVLMLIWYKQRFAI